MMTEQAAARLLIKQVRDAIRAVTEKPVQFVIDFAPEDGPPIDFFQLRVANIEALQQFHGELTVVDELTECGKVEVCKHVPLIGGSHLYVYCWLWPEEAIKRGLWKEEAG
ncbi:hypothetical protein H1S01_03095 [Heliobacterium chlorum]|uniref:Uncharacterized protein n=1 Tax=Heliobacterium chlorum TaxID=2698 RepID=A0ABR7SY85_HELCL|nr:hypothetical protein [Heliobacterium chlorum]MBC9783497.1 hypothetical protein [Heliobacterium chlorum]